MNNPFITDLYIGLKKNSPNYVHMDAPKSVNPYGHNLESSFGNLEKESLLTS